MIPKELIRTKNCKGGQEVQVLDVGSRVQISQRLAPASKGQRQTLWNHMLQTKKSLNRDWDLHRIWVRSACKKSHFYC